MVCKLIHEILTKDQFTTLFKELYAEKCGKLDIIVRDTCRDMYLTYVSLEHINIGLRSMKLVRKVN